MLCKYTKQLNSARSLNDIIRRGVPATAFGMQSSGKYHLITLIEEPVLYVVKDSYQALKALNEIQLMTDKEVIYLPAKDDVLTVADGYLKESTVKRATAVAKIADGAAITVTTIDAILQWLPKKAGKLLLKKDDSYVREEVIKQLVNMGYVRCDSAVISGQFSVRGDVFDVLLPDKTLVRLDFFDDVLESVKLFDSESGKSMGYSDSITFLPVSDFTVTEAEKGRVIALMQREIEAAPYQLKGKLKDLAEEWQGYMENGDLEKCQFAMPFSDSATDNIFDIFHGVTVFDEPQSIYDYSVLYEKEFISRCKAFCEECKAFTFTERLLLNVNLFIERLTNVKTLAFSTAITSNPFFPSLEKLKIETQNSVNYNEIWREFFNDVRGYLRNNYTVFICSESKTEQDKVKLQLEREGIKYVSVSNSENIVPSKVNFITVPLERGIIYSEEKIAILSVKEIVFSSSPKKQKVKAEATFFSAPETGDYVVHSSHGVGRVTGTKRIFSADGAKDYIAVEYLNGNLYVPVENFDTLTKYIGSEESPKLSKIGNGAFERVKQRVMESLKEMSIDLKALYSDRRSRAGFRFEEDVSQTLFDASFGFTDTSDQTTASEDIRKDMCSDKVMDRLICGDVGFGKTEVAFRAVYRAVVNGKQAVLLAPTTILTEQHYRTAVKRFEGFGVKVAVLNRFRTQKEQKEIIEGLKNGSIDFVIGTHRLLGKDVKFFDLGLLVLDEEQRFGVEHKEKIKLLKTNVDTLTLTATPIPRTLNMSLTGIRDISTLTVAPEGRLPVQTYVAEESDAILKDAIERELSRGGQVFVLYNRVETIANFASRIGYLAPSAKIIYAHGQMETRELEDRIKNFYDGKSDVLIATTIIENGIDLPKANALIVIDADRLGLSSLYQLKGRVGRSTRLARAYFTYKKDKVLSSAAYDRLSALVDFAEMGSGFKIAMRDLQIRGAGNVLGKEQHGHIAKIGYELYSRLLKEIVTGKKKPDVRLNVALSAIIPESYVESNSRRMEIYKEISESADFAALEETEKRLLDYYGPLPRATDNLIKLMRVKIMCQNTGVTEMFLDPKRAYFQLESLSVLNNGKMPLAMDVYGKRVFVSFEDSPKIEFRAQSDMAKTFADMYAFITLAAGEGNV